MPKKKTETHDDVNSILLGKRVKVKYRDENDIRSISGVVKAVNGVYLVLERDMGADTLFNHSVIDRIQLVEDEELGIDSHQNIIDDKKKNFGGMIR
ncbi:MAG: hypothetical protein QMC80_08430 [Thermoplasmatales archaeon]|nr:hypothetical protein [Thermoplasmatales archaeon]